jgi:hypothetical protein
VGGGAVCGAVQAISELSRHPLTLDALRRVLCNLRDHPEDPRFRQLKLSNPKVRDTLCFPQALQLLASVGFTELPDTDDAAAAAAAAGGGGGGGGAGAGGGTVDGRTYRCGVLVCGAVSDKVYITQLIQLLAGVQTPPSTNGRVPPPTGVLQPLARDIGGVVHVGGASINGTSTSGTDAAIEPHASVGGRGWVEGGGQPLASECRVGVAGEGVHDAPSPSTTARALAPAPAPAPPAPALACGMSENARGKRRKVEKAPNVD